MEDTTTSPINTALSMLGRQDSTSSSPTSPTSSASASSSTSTTFPFHGRPFISPQADGPLASCTDPENRLSYYLDIITFNFSQGCEAIVEQVRATYAGYDLATFFRSNTEIEPGCANIGHVDYCINTTAYSANFLSVPPDPDAGIPSNLNCSEYLLLDLGDTCEELGGAYKFNGEQFDFLNAQTTCSTLTPGDYVCVRPTNATVYPSNSSAFLSQELNSGTTSSATGSVPLSSSATTVNSSVASTGTI
ncbi:hypothetical protein B0H14DRAFT_2740660 [Mycena olivaceomarginata]|nr:hypothetical protein B0H14DRAFT_2740660 [Mycena olivaceomarginata]